MCVLLAFGMCYVQLCDVKCAALKLSSKKSLAYPAVGKPLNVTCIELQY